MNNERRLERDVAEAMGIGILPEDVVGAMEDHLCETGDGLVLRSPGKVGDVPWFMDEPRVIAMMEKWLSGRCRYAMSVRGPGWRVTIEGGPLGRGPLNTFVCHGATKGLALARAIVAMGPAAPDRAPEVAAFGGPIYELVDTTDDERYFTTSLWLRVEDAIAAMEGFRDGASPSDVGEVDHFDSDVATFELRERVVGWPDHRAIGKAVCRWTWTRVVSDSDCPDEWTIGFEDLRG